MSSVFKLFRPVKLSSPVPHIDAFPAGCRLGEIANVGGYDWCCTDESYATYCWSRYDKETESIVSTGANRSGMLGGRNSIHTRAAIAKGEAK